MHLCGICLQDVEAPASLPCGHIFCSECLSRAVDAIKQYSSLHCCPVCRSRYSPDVHAANSDPNTSPLNSHHAIPSIRRLYLDRPTSLPEQPSSATDVIRENRRLQAEISALRTNCEMWRKRAEAHGAATHNLLTRLKIARDEASRVQRQVEQNELVQQYDVLKGRFEGDKPSQIHPQLLSSSTNDALTSTMNVSCERPPPDLPTLLRLTYSNSPASSSPPKHFASTLKSEFSRPTKRMRR